MCFAKKSRAVVQTIFKNLTKAKHRFAFPTEIGTHRYTSSIFEPPKSSYTDCDELKGSSGFTLLVDNAIDIYIFIL